MTSIRLTPAELQDLLDQYPRSAEPDVGHRAHLLLLLDAGHRERPARPCCSVPSAPSVGGSGGSTARGGRRPRPPMGPASVRYPHLGHTGCSMAADARRRRLLL